MSRILVATYPCGCVSATHLAEDVAASNLDSFRRTAEHRGCHIVVKDAGDIPPARCRKHRKTVAPSIAGYWKKLEAASAESA